MRLAERYVVLGATIAFALTAAIAASSSCGGTVDDPDAGIRFSSSGAPPYTTTPTTPTGFPPPTSGGFPQPQTLPDAGVPIVACGGVDAGDLDGGSVCDQPPLPRCEGTNFLASYGSGPCDAGRCAFTVSLVYCPAGCYAGGPDAGDVCTQAIGK